MPSIIKKHQYERASSIEVDDDAPSSVQEEAVEEKCCANPTTTSKLQSLWVCCAGGVGVFVALVFLRVVIAVLGSFVLPTRPTATNESNPSISGVNETAVPKPDWLGFDNQPMKEADPVNTGKVNTTALPASNLSTKGANSSHCLMARGHSGHWVQDSDYTERHSQYSVNKWNYSFSATRNATTYRFVDDNCEFSRVEHRGFCNFLESRNIERVLFAGDSTSQQMALSLYKLLGGNEEPSNDASERHDWTRPICIESSSQTNKQLVYIRNDHLDNSSSPVSADDYDEKCKNPKDAFCLNWLGRWVSSKDPTLLILNFGSHVHKVSTFEYELQELMRILLLNSIESRPDDVVFYRTTPPGHKGCQSATTPYFSMEEMPLLRPSPRSWHLFGQYNEIGELLYRFL